MDLRVIRFSDSDYAERLKALNRSARPNEKVYATVREIVDRVAREGDAALVDYTQRFDKISLTPAQFRLTGKAPKPDAKALKALQYSLNNIRAFSARRLPKDWKQKNREGAWVGEQYRPFQRISVNVPGGTAPLVSSALMTVALAKIAGVKEIVVNTPPPVNPVLHYALVMSGATEIYQLGGAQAIAALAYGTATIPAVQKIFGPGNAYVVEAKRQVVGAVAIDQLPGPSEIAVLADASACADFVAADLLAQAEHGHGSQILLVTPSAKVIDQVKTEIERQLPSLPRQNYLSEVLQGGSAFVQTRNLAEAVAVVENYAPEHLSLITKNGRELAKKIKNSGAIFIGNYSPVAAGDFVAGPSHTLPTGGAGKSFPGLTIDQFFKRTSVVEYTSAAIKKVVPYIETFGQLERLDAHGRSASIRSSS